MKRCSPSILVLLFAAAASAQTMTEQGYRPVDQVVEDVDPLGVSLRKIDPGLQSIGEQNTVYRRIVPGETPYDREQTNRLYYVSYGVVAEYDRSEYIYLFDRKGRPAGMAQRIPPNTVFHIGLPDSLPAPAVATAQSGQLSGRVDGAAWAPMHGTPAREATPDDAYRQVVRTQRSVVVGALQRPSE